MIETPKNPSVNFLLNKRGFNIMIDVLTFNIHNDMVSKKQRENARELKEMLLKYCIPYKDNNKEVSIVEVNIYPKESADLITQFVDIFDDIKVKDDYTKYLKRH